MKKYLLMAALAFGALSANAQNLTLNTFSGTDVAQFNGLTRNVTVNRNIFNGWNTISLPFALSAEQVNEFFGSDCRLEALVGIEQVGGQIKLNFQDCKAEGMKANVPYILHFTGETCSKKIVVPNAVIKHAPASVSFSDVNGVKVTFACAQKQVKAQGLYGILAKDNSEASFVNVDDVATSGFYATRCYVQLSNGNSTLLTTNHIEAGETTAISSVLRSNESADVFNLSGSKVASSLNVRGINSLPAGIYVVKGKKVAVR